MSKRLKVLVFAGALLAAMSGTAVAHGHVRFSVTFGTPVFVAPPPPVYYYYPSPRVVYYPPAPVYSVYYAPAVRVVRPHGWRGYPRYRSR